MADNRNKGVSLAKGPVALLGLAMLAWGILSLLFGGNGFSTRNVPDGPIPGAEFLGVEGNGWTNLAWVVGGALLLLAAPLHWGAKTMSLIVGLALGALSVISLVTHWDGRNWGAFGIFAADNWTTLLWGAAATYLLVSALLPRVGKDKHKDRDRDRDIDLHRSRPVERERVVEQPRVERETRVEREPTMTNARPANVVDREVVGRDDRDSINDHDVERGGRFTREERITERTSGTTGGGGAVSPRRDERL
jgi:hypothetical protein